MLPYFQVKVPYQDNSGRDITANHREFEERLFNLYDGFDCWQVAGSWRNPEGKTFREVTIIYQIACKGAKLYIERQLRAIAKECYPDQEAIFVAHIGTASIM